MEDNEEEEVADFFHEKDVFGFDKSTTALKDRDAVEKKPAREPAGDLSVTYAPLSTRIAAYILDLVILSVGLIIILYLFFDPATYEAPDFEGFDAFDLLSILLGIVYFAGFESSAYQATPGKRICGIMVVDEYGERIGFGKGVARHLAKILSILPLGLGVWVIAFDAKRQGWHDLLVGCFVIEGKPGVGRGQSQDVIDDVR